VTNIHSEDFLNVPTDYHQWIRHLVCDGWSAFEGLTYLYVGNYKKVLMAHGSSVIKH